MNPWDLYQSRISVSGSTLRESMLNREASYLSRKIPSNLSYHVAEVDGVEQRLAIINSDNLVLKTMCTMPGEDLLSGSLVKWLDLFWLVTERDANNEIYTKVKAEQCNYLLKWIDDEGSIIERWCLVHDGTKYMIGETSGRSENNLVLGDSRVAVTLPYDADTSKLGRRNRFVIDILGMENMLTYRLSKPLKVGGIYDGHGVMAFIMSEENSNDDDNFDLCIADYYKYFPRTVVLPDVPAASPEEGRVWF